MHSLTGKRTIVTGAGSGIGRASALRFAAEGALVCAVDRERSTADETVAAIVAAGGRAIAVAGDAGAEEDVGACFAAALEAFGGIDVVFANAGIAGTYAPLAEQSAGDWMAVLRVNLIGAFLAIKHATPVMTKHGGGSIICTASVAGQRANAGPSPYSASKAGVISLVQTSANALAGTGIRVNAICPGLIETGMTQPMFDSARARGKADRIGQLNPLRRAGQPGEVAALAVFLASDEASYVNGQAIAVDGGLSSTHPFVPSQRGSTKLE